MACSKAINITVGPALVCKTDSNPKRTLSHTLCPPAGLVEARDDIRLQCLHSPFGEKRNINNQKQFALAKNKQNRCCRISVSQNSVEMLASRIERPPTIILYPSYTLVNRQHRSKRTLFNGTLPRCGIPISNKLFLLIHYQLFCMSHINGDV